MVTALRLRAQAIRRALLLGCSRRILSICACNALAMFFLASSKLLPPTVTDGLLQSPFQPSSSDQKSQSIGMLAVTWRFTTGEVIITALESWLRKLINVEKHSGHLDVYRSGGNLLAESQQDLCRITRSISKMLIPRDERVVAK